MERKYALAVGRDYLSPITSHVELTADVIVSKLRKFHVIPHTQAEYAAMTPKEKAVLKKESGFLIGGNFGGRKTKADCQYRSIVTLDLDALTPETAQQCIEKLRLLGCRAVVYSTASHTPEKPRLRAFVFLANDVEPDKYSWLVKSFAGLLPKDVISSETYKVSQLMYRPQRCSDGEEVFIELPGGPLDATAFLATLPADTTPERKSEATPAWSKPGIVGAVARIYEGDFDRAIAELDLPYVRSTAGPTCGVGEDRYSYTKGAGADGAIWYAGDGHLYSHHGTDPAREQNATIFDVWRLHNADPAKDDPAAPIHERASHKAAQDWFVSRFPALTSEVRAEADPSELEDLGPPERPLEALERAFEPATEPAIRFGVQKAGAFSEGPPPGYWVKGVVPDGDLVVIYGASGSGKSFLAWDMACAVERGTPWMDRKTRKGRSVYICAEGGGGFRTRVRAYAAENQIDPNTLPGVIPDAPNLLEVEDIKSLVHSVRAYGPIDIIWVDTFAATTPGADENTSKDIGLALSHCKSLSRILNCLVVLVHHSGKDAARGARGWSGLRAASDGELEVSRDGDLRVLKVTKSKDGRDGDLFPFRLMVVPVGLDIDGDELTSCVIEAAELQSTGPGIKLNRPQRETLGWLEEQWVQGYFDTELLLKAVSDKCAEPSLTLRARRQKAERRVQKLHELGVAHWALDGTQIKPGKSGTEANKEYDDE